MCCGCAEGNRDSRNDPQDVDILPPSGHEAAIAGHGACGFRKRERPGRASVYREHRPAMESTMGTLQ